MNKCRCDERLQTKTKEFTRLPYTGKDDTQGVKKKLDMSVARKRHKKLAVVKIVPGML
jgi:hypothetical protein